MSGDPNAPIVPAGKTLSFTVSMPDGSSRPVTIDFPLPNGDTLVHGPLSYDADGMTTRHSIAWAREPRFAEAYRHGMATDHGFGPDLHVEWRVFLPCWAARVAKDLPGDFVECGVNSGILSAAICNYIDFGRLTDKRFYLLDTFAGFPMELLKPEERALGFEEALTGAYADTYENVKATFAAYPNVTIVRGRVPDTLTQVPSERIAYLCIDMNAAIPERAAIEYFWDKIVPGGMVVLDDFGYRNHDAQRLTMEEFARLRDVGIFSLPTGQALIVKPHR